MHPFFELLGFEIPGYGAAIGVGVLTGYALAAFLGKRSRIGGDLATTLFLLCLACGLVGSKLLSWIVEGKADIREGGVFYGGMIGTALAIIVTTRLKKTSTLDALDVMVPVGAWVHGCGRIGCWLIGCCYGRPTESALGMPFPQGSTAYQSLSATEPALIHGSHTVNLIPTQLLEAGLEFMLVVVLSAALLRRLPRGVVAFAWGCAYSIFRFIIEYFRFDPERGTVLGGALSTSQLLSILLLVISVPGLYLALRGRFDSDLRSS